MEEFYHERHEQRTNEEGWDGRILPRTTRTKNEQGSLKRKNFTTNHTNKERTRKSEKEEFYHEPHEQRTNKEV